VKREVVFRPSVLSDLKDLHDFIEIDSPVAAARYVEQIEEFCMSLSEFSERGTTRNDLGPGMRTIGFRRRIMIAFVVGESFVEIARILYGGRDLGQAMDEDFL